MGNAAWAERGGGGRETGQLAAGVVDVQAPGLAVEGFGHGVSDAGEADGVRARRAGRHRFEGGVAEATFAFVESRRKGGFLGVEVGSECEVEDFEGRAALVEEGLEDGGV